MPYHMILLLIAAGLSISHASSIYISNDGKDRNNCGSSQKIPCRSLEYAFRIMEKRINAPSNDSQEIDVMILNGGSGAPMKYEINETIYLANSITFTSNNNSFNPIITQGKPYSENMHSFLVTSISSKISVSFKLINFDVDIGIIKCSNACVISFYGCSITKKDKYFERSLAKLSVVNFNTMLSTTERSALSIKNCRFSGLYYVLSSNTSISISINDTLISGGRIWHESKNANNLLSLIIDNVAISDNCEICPEVISIKTRGHLSIYILNSKLHNIKKADILIDCLSRKDRIDSSAEVFIHKTSISNCYRFRLRFYFVKLQLTDSLIEKNEFLGIILHGTSAIMRSIKISGNKILDGLLFSPNGKLQIQLTRVADNEIASALLSTYNSSFTLINSEFASTKRFQTSKVSSTDNPYADNNEKGLVDVHSSTEVNMTNNKFTGNDANNIIYVNSSTVAMTRNSFEENCIAAYIVNVSSSVLRLISNRFIKNNVSYVFHSSSSLITIDKNDFMKNIFKANALYFTNSDIHISNTSFFKSINICSGGGR